MEKKKAELSIIFNNILYFFTVKYSNFIITIFFPDKKKSDLAYVHDN